MAARSPAPMRRLLNIYRLGVKELISLWNDKVLLIMIIWAFSGGIYSAATATSQELHNAPIAIVDEDQSVLSSRIAGAFYGPYFKTPEMIVESQVDAGLDAGTFTFVLTIPPDFERDVLAGTQPGIQLNIDAMRVSQAFIGAGYIQNIVLGEVAEFVQHRREEAVSPISLTPTILFNPNLTSAWFGSVMEMINNVTMLSVILTGAALIREREHGTLEHLMVMPIGAFEIMLAKVWAMALVVWVAVLLSLYFVVERALGGADRRLDSAVHGRCAGAAARDHLAGHLHRHAVAQHAAARPHDDSGRAAAGTAVRRHDAARKHAGGGAEHHAVRTHHAFRQPRAGGAVPRRRARCRVAQPARHGRDRTRLLRRLAADVSGAASRRRAEQFRAAYASVSNGPPGPARASRSCRSQSMNRRVRIGSPRACGYTMLTGRGGGSKSASTTTSRPAGDQRRHLVGT
jgi:hypothetical protein